MPFDAAGARQRLRDFDLQGLFVEELGWERHAATHTINLDGNLYRLDAVAHKRGLAVFICEPAPNGQIPDYPTRRKIDRQVARIAHEHIIVFLDSARTAQTWQWVKREPGKPAACRQHTFYRGQPGDALLQILQALNFTLDEEAGLTLLEVTGRVRTAFDVERVTKRFYDRFKSEHQAFSKFLRGIPDKDMQRWYVSVMLNRLMFIYFIQKKGFLGDNNPHYLRDKLAESKRRSKDIFYREFLCLLFFEGFAKKEAERAAATNALLSKVPYLNGGLFLRHQIEQRYGTAIQITDSAFEKLFAFFDQYHWHLDDRPLKADNEINPDVLGYIFEKYVNQKQMGAYYSKEDITGYISQNTVIPFLFDQARKGCKIAFEGEQSVWRLLQGNPDRYIYDAVKHGVILDARQRPPKTLQHAVPFPPEIAVGLNDVSKRGEWNKPAPGQYALPTEVWREVIARRQHHEEVRDKLAAGKVRSINDLITHNLDIRQFAQDVIENSEGPELLRAFYKAIKSVSVLDPACGSGAFLFAALNILEPLYEACLDRMQVFLDELEQSKEKHRPEKFGDFKKELDLVAAHPNRKYFIYKTIIINNLFGVDIMDEATEICKLRLFLKLVAQIDRTEQIEPLPDIDFNIRAGNTLVGYASYDDLKRAITSKLDFENNMERIEERAREIDRLFRLFREMQSDQRMEARDFGEAKQELLRRLKTLEEELNYDLAGEYAVKVQDRASYEKWLASHKPFHWFIEFYGIMRGGGFDVTIGNPPYIELKELTEYGARGYKCETAGNLYALFIERSTALCSVHGRKGFIVPVSSVSTDRYSDLQDILLHHDLHFSSFDDRPSRLFDGLEHIRLSIHLMAEPTSHSVIHSTRYNKWNAEERPVLFSTLTYAQSGSASFGHTLPKLCSPIEDHILQKLFAQGRTLATQYSRYGRHCAYYSRKIGYFAQVLDFEPRVLDSKGKRRPPSEFKALPFANRMHAAAAVCCLNSSIFYWFLTVFSDCRHVNKREIDNFPIDLSKLLDHRIGTCLLDLEPQLMVDLKRNSEERRMRFEHDVLTVQCIIPKRSKPILDRIDVLLAEYYKFSPRELDFILNYDIKYRVGDELIGADD